MNEHATTSTLATWEALMALAVCAAKRGAEVIREGARRRADLVVEHKRLNDLVSEVDRLSEAAIIAEIQQAHPDHAILAEEGGGGTRAGSLTSGASDFLWIIDPLDGTTNFLHGFDHFAVSIGLQYQGAMVVAVVLDPIRQHLFQAIRGQGATLNGAPIQVAQRASLREALISTGLPYPTAADATAYFPILDRIWRGCRDIRRPGAAALDLAYVAAGFLDGFFEFALLPWDIAAGALLVQEAGGCVSDLHGGATYLQHGYIVAGTPQVHVEMINQINQVIDTEAWYRPAGRAPV